MGPEISIVSPVYRAKVILPELLSEICAAVEPLNIEFEIILVEDGCPENSWEVVEKLKGEYPMLRAFKLSRNFGQHYAITAGISKAQGKYVVVMDCDLQDDPKMIPELISKSKENDDSIVLARRMNRQDGFIKRTISFLFHSMLSFLSGLQLDPRVGNFGVYPAKAINAILEMKDNIRYFPAMVVWVGFNRMYLDIKHRARFEGKSSYNFARLLSLAVDILLSFSDKPIRLVIYSGIITSMVSFILMFYYLISAYLGVFQVSGFASIMVSVWFLGGVLLLALGVIGMYVGKAFQAVKRRPTFIIERTI